MVIGNTWLRNIKDSWWRRPAGGREVLVVALPLVVSSLSWTVMTFIDRMFLSSISEAAMSASFTGSVVWFALICFPMGICSYTNTFVSQYFGDEQPERIGPSMWQGVWTAAWFAPLVLGCIPFRLNVVPMGRSHAGSDWPGNQLLSDSLPWRPPLCSSPRRCRRFMADEAKPGWL